MLKDDRLNCLLIVGKSQWCCASKEDVSDICRRYGGQASSNFSTLWPLTTTNNLAIITIFRSLIVFWLAYQWLGENSKVFI